MSDYNQSLEEKWATWIIGLSIVTFLICGTALALLNIKREAPIVQHKVEFATDSTGQEKYSKSQVDSLILVIQSQERALSQKYQYILEKRERDDSSKTLITFVIGAIISICGFFGYKSFKDIKEHGEKIAEKKAVETAQSIISAQLPEMMSREMTKIYKAQSVEVIKQSLLQELTSTLESYIDAAVAEKIEDLKADALENSDPIDSDKEEQGKSEDANAKIEDSILFE